MKPVIFLVDMNAFFMGCEMTRRPELKGKPAAVAGDPLRRSGIILAANYEAREFGVKTTMLLHEAKKLCPGIAFVPPDHRFYEEKSQQVMEILSRFSPVVEQNSIDEAWMNLSGCECLFGSPLEIAQRIMDCIREELDLWCSIGISENKFLAKMASERKKPLGITQIWQEDVAAMLWPLPVREMYGIGKQTERKLSQMGVFTIGELASLDRKLLSGIFGKYGDELHRLSNGIDASPVAPHSKQDSKSISRSTTLSEDITNLEDAKTILLQLAEEVGSDTRRHGYRGRTVSIEIKYASFESITRQRSISPTSLTRDIYRTGIGLLTENWNADRPVRLLGIGISNFDQGEVQQISLFDTIKDTSGGAREEKLEKAIDAIRDRFGTGKIKRARNL